MVSHPPSLAPRVIAISKLRNASTQGQNPEEGPQRKREGLKASLHYKPRYTLDNKLQKGRILFLYCLFL